MSEAHATICTPGASRWTRMLLRFGFIASSAGLSFHRWNTMRSAVGDQSGSESRVLRVTGVSLSRSGRQSRRVQRKRFAPHPLPASPSRSKPGKRSGQSAGSAARARSVAAQGSRCRLRMDRHQSQASRRWGQPRGRVLVIEGGVDRKAATPTAVRTDDVNPVAGARIAVIAMRIDDQSTVRRERRICVRPAEIDARATPRWTGELPDMRGPRISEPNSGLDARPDTAVRQQPVSAGNDASAAGMENTEQTTAAIANRAHNRALIYSSSPQRMRTPRGGSGEASTNNEYRQVTRLVRNSQLELGRRLADGMTDDGTAERPTDRPDVPAARRAR